MVYGLYRLDARLAGAWSPQYEFDTAPQEFVDFVPANFFTSRHADSLFVRKLIVVRQTPAGRAILLDRQLRLLERGEATVRDLQAHEVDTVLWNVFRLRWPSAEG